MNKSSFRQKKILAMIRITTYIQVGIALLVVGFFGIRYLLNGTLPGGSSSLILLLSFLIMISVNGYFAVKGGIAYKGIGEQLSLQEEAIHNIEALNKELRAQRHDFKNQLQVIYSLTELQDYEAVKSFLNKIYGDIGKVSEHIKTASPAINALLQVKANEAESRGVAYHVSINSRLDQMNIPDIEFCRVLGNLIDNGIEASIKTQKKKVEIDISESFTSYIIVVRNTCQHIEKDLLNHMFESGISTKDEPSEHGMGLYIVSSLLDKYEGHIDMVYEPGEIAFTISIQKMTV